MTDENIDQFTETPADSGQNEGEKSGEGNITQEQIQERFSALTKGYTTTRQDLAAFKDEVLSAIGEIKDQRAVKDEYGVDDDLVTKKDIADITAQIVQGIRAEKDADKVELARYEQLVDEQLAELKVSGIVKTKAEEEDLLSYAAEKKITDLFKAADIWQEVKEVRKTKEELRAKLKGEEGGKVGTSNKVNSKEQGISYKEIANKDWDELTE